MLFNSYIYLFFLIGCVILYWAAPKLRKFSLIIFGSIFYVYYDIKYFYLILGLAVFTFFIGHILIKNRNKKILIMGIIVIAGTLVYFKYTNMLIGTLNGIGYDMPLTSILMPLGISFFTFEFIHYLVDIYKGYIVKNDFLTFCSFAFFFPSLISGPIKRYEQFSQQSEDVSFRPEFFYYGALLIVLGYTQKYILADNFSPLSSGLNDPANITSSLSALKQLYFYSFRIYFDFSGMSHIAIGSALLFGYVIPKNFNFPYLRTNISTFWRNWHMSLSNWVRDYLFIPLGGSRSSQIITAMNSVLVMFIVGLWHGASWNFALWGLWHGLGLSIYQLHKKYTKGWVDSKIGGSIAYSALAALVGIFITFNFVTIGWAFFAVSNSKDAFILLSKLF